MKYFLVIVDAIAILFVVAMYFKWHSSKNTNKENTNENISQEVDVKEVDVKEINFGNYTIAIPENYTYEYDKNNENGIFLIKRVNSSTGAYAYVEKYKNSNPDEINNPENMALQLQELGYAVSDAKKIEYKNKSIVVMNYDDNDDETVAILAYSTIDDTYGVEITVYCNDGTQIMDNLYSILDILNTASIKKDEVSNNQ